MHQRILLLRYSLAYRNGLTGYMNSDAICWYSSFMSKSTSNHSRSFNRAMVTDRQTSIAAFPIYECMQQWDALHGMLIYEDLELRETICDATETWNYDPSVKGLCSFFSRR
ncbi:hypothetical protein B0O99DRAFT_74829 [Bisporella sp. PMI_857]|nr:hypothetical protein B0O99DRAFT_74829 [Bisporella sp. PMI_857]